VNVGTMMNKKVTLLLDVCLHVDQIHCFRVCFILYALI